SQVFRLARIMLPNRRSYSPGIQTGVPSLYSAHRCVISTPAAPRRFVISMTSAILAWLMPALALAVSPAEAEAEAKRKAAAEGFRTEGTPFLTTYCVECHKS